MEMNRVPLTRTSRNQNPAAIFSFHFAKMFGLKGLTRQACQGNHGHKAAYTIPYNLRQEMVLFA